MDPFYGQLAAFILGLADNFIASALYEKYKSGRSLRAERIRTLEAAWQSKLRSESVMLRSQAFRDIAMRMFGWFLLGNVMFGISGMTWLLEYSDLKPFGNALTGLTSLLAVIMFGVALSWIRLYNRLSGGTPPPAVPTGHDAEAHPVASAGDWAGGGADDAT